MMQDLGLTSYDYYSSRRDMEIISKIVESLKKILEEDKKEAQPLFLKTSENLILNIARKVVQEKKKTFLIGITGESASGKTVFVDNTIKACIKDKKEGIYTVIRCDDYYKDTSKELQEAGSYEELFKTGFSFDTPDVIDLQLMKQHLAALKEGMRRLNEREKLIIRKRFFQGKTQMEVADEIGISQAQVSRLEKAAIKQMNKNIQH